MTQVWPPHQQSPQPRWQHIGLQHGADRQTSSRKLARRQARAWEVAQRAATCLKAQFGAERGMVFGSLVRAGCFTLWSDVDIAAWGLSPQDTFRAIGVVLELDTTIAINLVDVGTCRPELLASIEQEGIEL